MKDAYIAIKASDQIVEIGTSRLQKYSRFRVSSEREQFAPCVETGVGKQLPCVDRRASACRVPNIRCGKSQLTCPSLPFAGKKGCLISLIYEQCRGGSRIFFKRGCTRLLLYFNTNKTHSFFFLFLVNTSCIRKPQVISGEGGGAVRTPCTLLLDPPLQW